MRFSIFSKAEKLVELVKLESETDDRAYFDVDTKKVCIVCNGKYTYIESCTCQSCAIHYGTASLKGNKPLCSYQIAALIHLSQIFNNFELLRNNLNKV